MKKNILIALVLTFFFISTHGIANAFLITDPAQLSDASIDINFDTTFPADVGNITITGDITGLRDISYWSPTPSSYASGNVLEVGPGGVYINFLTPVNEVGFGLWDPNWTGTGFEAFDLNGNSLTGFVQSPMFQPGGHYATYMGMRETSNVISTVKVSMAPGDLLGLDNISFSPSPVPEPTTILLLGSGLIGIAGFRRKLKKLT